MHPKYSVHLQALYHAILRNWWSSLGNVGHLKNNMQNNSASESELWLFAYLAGYPPGLPVWFGVFNSLANLLHQFIQLHCSLHQNSAELLPCILMEGRGRAYYQQHHRTTTTETTLRSKSCWPLFKCLQYLK